MDKTYNPSSYEQEIYEYWENGGFFRAEVDKSKKPFTIVMPPPNITGQLHMGHALDETVQDVIIRHKRMQGYSALWLPGTDHASIATEVKIVEKLKADEGLTKRDIGREEFLKRAFDWKKQYGGRIVRQLRKLGSSCDWSREAFTMDERCSKAVKEVFIKLYNEGLIYRGDRIINWCPGCKTALSDAEVEYEEKASHLWHIRYPYADGSGYIVVATTRPETMLGDTAVAVNPNDEKYFGKVGKTLILPLVNKEIPIVADEYVEIGFGTGAVKITPAHDPNDFEVGLRHNLEVIRVMDDGGVMNENAGVYKGLDRDEARKRIVEDLEKGGYMEKIEDYTHNVGQCYRCSSAVEPIVSKQWFVRMEPLAKPAIEVVKDGTTRFIPDRFSKIYFNWMENIKDWCISRQLWWGHRIPAYYCEECGEMVVAADMPSVCPKCGCTHFHQDEDVLDTWFSSALWPFSTLGYPESTEDLEYFYPTNVLVTAYDIIFFWVARMIFSGVKHMGKAPFSEVLIHGIVRDSQGRKMSKSLGNGVDPLVVIEKYGADSLRFSLMTGVAPGGDIRYQEERIESARNFMNKLWNASRFVSLNVEGKTLLEPSKIRLTAKDKWIIKKMQDVTAEVNRNLDKYEIGLASSKLYDFVWSDFCDWYIELSKPALYGSDEEEKLNATSALSYVLKTILKLMHPFVPFVTEKLWHELGETSPLMLEKYPSAEDFGDYSEEASRFELIMSVIRQIRATRSEMNVDPSKKPELYLVTTLDSDYVGANEENIKKLASVSSVRVVESKESIGIDKLSSVIIDGAEIYMPLGELVDYEAEKARISKDIKKLESEIARGNGMLNNPGFLAKAPAHLVEQEKEKLANNKALLDNLKSKLASL